MTRLRSGGPKGERFGGLLCVLGLASTFLLWTAGSAAHAQGTCNGNVGINYDSVQVPNTVGSIDTVRVTMSTGPISGGSQLTINGVRFNLDCTQLSLPGCADDGNVIRYQGDSTITTTCVGTAWSSNSVAGGTTPNEIIFTPTPALVLPSNNGGCSISFQIRKESGSNDTTPNQIEQRAFYAVGDATCDNGLSSTSANTASLGFGADSGRRGAPLLGGLGSVLLLLSLALLGARKVARRG